MRRTQVSFIYTITYVSNVCIGKLNFILDVIYLLII